MLDVEAERDGSSAAAQATESFSALLSQVSRRETHPAFSCSLALVILLGQRSRAKKSSEESHEAWCRSQGGGQSASGAAGASVRLLSLVQPQPSLGDGSGLSVAVDVSKFAPNQTRPLD